MADKFVNKRLLGRAAETSDPVAAARLYQRLLASPDLTAGQRSEALLGLARLQIGQGQVSRQTVVGLHQAMALSPNSAAVCLCLAQLEEMLGRFAEAAGHFERALALAGGDDVEALYGLGRLAHRQRQYRRALDLYRQAGRHAQSARFDILRDQARVYYLLGQPDEAERCYRQLLAGPDSLASDDNDLGIILAERGDFFQAIEHYRHALQRRPGWPAACNNLGNALHQLGRFDEARAAYLAVDTVTAGAVEDSRSVVAVAASNRLFLESYNVLCPPDELCRLHRQWAERFAPVERAGRCRHPSPRRQGDVSGPLRIGYVSPDLRRHPVGSFIEGLLTEHDRQSFTVHCYAELRQEDSLSRRLRALADGWTNTVELDDEALAAAIYRDGIDILVDLAGHTRGHRLGVFAWRPAPVQVSYLGYCTTTGVAAMDYWLTDHWLTPEDTVERTTETIWRLPRCWLCYRPDEKSPPAPERDRRRPLTFGSFNDLGKLTDAVIDTWAQILRQLPESRLLLKAAQLSDARVVEDLNDRFCAHGITGSRIEYRGRSRDFLAQYADVDIALDPFPRTGGATTVDALWMATPVITLAGRRMIERQGGSLLQAAGLPELIAETVPDYIDKAIALAQDGPRLQTYHEQLRARIQASPLCDARDLAHQVEVAYQGMWRHWLAHGGAGDSGSGDKGGR